MGHAARWEYFRVIYGRYGKAESKAKRGMLDEFCLNTGYHRKYAIRLLNGPPPGKREEARPRGRKRQYSPAVVTLLAAVWAAAGEKEPVPAAPVRADQIGDVVEAPHSGEDRQLECEHAGVCRDRSGVALGQQRGGRIRLHVEPDRHSERVDGITRSAGKGPGRRAAGAGRDSTRLAFRSFGIGLGQRLGVHQLASRALV